MIEFKKEKKMIIAIGLPGSGKSSMRPENYITISGDDIRFMFYDYQHSGIDYIKDLDPIVWDCIYLLIERLMKEGFNIYIDDINHVFEIRQIYLTLAKKHDYEIGYYLFKNFNEAYTRNFSRKRVVPLEEMERIRTEFQFPLEEEKKVISFLVVID